MFRHLLLFIYLTTYLAAHILWDRIERTCHQIRSRWAEFRASYPD